MLAAVRVRGRKKLDPKVKHTLHLLKLKKPNHCRLFEDTKEIRGMLKVADNYITYGPVDEETISKLEEREEKSEKGVYKLSPPSKGYKDVKKLHPKGSLGHRDNIEDLLKRMIR